MYHLTLFGCIFLLACTPEEGEPDMDWSPRSVAGSWNIEGEGEIYSCQSKRYNTDDLKIHMKSLEVSQNEENLSLAKVIQVQEGSFSFTGRARGLNINFSTIEVGPLGTIEMNFSGELISPLEAEGSFQGSGPGECRSEGEFNLKIH